RRLTCRSILGSKTAETEHRVFVFDCDLDQARGPDLVRPRTGLYVGSSSCVRVFVAILGQRLVSRLGGRLSSWLDPVQHRRSGAMPCVEVRRPSGPARTAPARRPAWSSGSAALL